jgi:tight adherence protein C
MNASEIAIGFTIAYILYEILGHVLPAKKAADVPWATQEPQRTSRKGLQGLSGIGKKFAFNQWLLKNEGYRRRLDLLLIRSGHPFEWTIEDLLFFKFIMLGVAAVILWFYDATNPLIWLVGLYIGFQFLDAYLKAKASARGVEIQRRLPGFIDLLTLTIEGGLDLIAALERIMEKMKPGPLKEELATIAQEIRLGTQRKEALEHWVYRTNLPDVQSLTAMIIQSEELGTSLATVLRSYADDMRNRRITRAEEIAGKAPVKLLFPMMVFFFPIVFVIIFGPIAMSVISSTK